MSRSYAAPAVSLREVNGAWWFVDAGAQLFVSLGLNHVEAPLMLGPHNRRRTLKRYGADFVLPDGTPNPEGEGLRRWLKRVRVDMGVWGFNTLGYHTMVPQQLLGNGLHYVRRACTCGIEPYRRDVAYPDIFSDAFASDVERRLTPVCAEVREDPFCLGYAFADCPPWRVPAANAPATHPWIAHLASAPASTAGKQAWLQLLRERHESAEAVAKTYGLQAADWDGLAATDDWSAATDPKTARADSEAMLAQLAERWYHVHCEVVRREDPFRLVLGDKLVCGPEGLPDYLVPIVARYTDVLYIQWYARFDEQVEVLRDLHQRTGLPVLLGDSSFSVHLDCHSPHSKGIPVANHLEVGESYAGYLRAAMETGFVVGWHYCGYIEGRKGVTPDHAPTLERQCGLLDPFENEHADAVAWLRGANDHANIWHARPIP